MGAFTTFRRNLLTAPIFRWAQKALPAMSATESDAIEAGDTWWDAALFSGHPDWQQLLDTPPAALTDAEQAFLDGPVVAVCRMVDDWRVNFIDHDLPPAVWDYLKEQRFFGMIIPRNMAASASPPMPIRKSSAPSPPAASLWR